MHVVRSNICRVACTESVSFFRITKDVLTEGLMNFINFQPSVRKTHCNGRKHKENVRDYYQKWLEEQVQKLVDDTSE